MRALFRLMGWGLLLTTWTCPVDARQVPSSRDAVSAKLVQEGDHYSFEGEFLANADPRTAWEVLTDYDNLPKFVSNIKGSVRERDGQCVLIQQIGGGGGFLFFTASVETLLHVHEEPYRSISFEDTGRKHFGKYMGVWSIHPDAGGSRVTYKLDVERNGSTPGFVKPGLLKRVSKEMLCQVHREMERRERLRRK